MKKLAIILTASALSAPAFAGGLSSPVVEPIVTPAPAPVYMPSTDWSGFYAGGQVGYGDIDSNGAGLDGHGWGGGVHAGYRWDLARPYWASKAAMTSLTPTLAATLARWTM